MITIITHHLQPIRGFQTFRPTQRFVCSPVHNIKQINCNLLIKLCCTERNPSSSSEFQSQNAINLLVCHFFSAHKNEIRARIFEHKVIWPKLQHRNGCVFFVCQKWMDHSSDRYWKRSWAFALQCTNEHDMIIGIGKNACHSNIVLFFFLVLFCRWFIYLMVDLWWLAIECYVHCDDDMCIFYAIAT